MSCNVINKTKFLLSLLAVLLIATAKLASAQVPNAAYSSNGLINITPGSNESQLCFSWATLAIDSSAFPYYIQDDTGTSYKGVQYNYDLPVPQVQIIDASNDTGTFYGVSIESYYTASGVTAAAGWYQNKVTVSGLKNNSSYKYRVGYTAGPGAGWSNFFTFQTKDPTSFSFIAVGDPQIGANTSGSLEPPAQKSNVQAYDSIGWINTMAIATQKVSNASFMLSLGDQIDNTSSQAGADVQYVAYFSPAQMQGLPVANIDGNHDFGLGQYYGYHYNLPNLSTLYGATQFGNDGDYWFTYGQALFIVLNSNNLSATTHDVFIGQAIAANPNATWKIVSFHHALYSCADHAFDSDILFRRSAYSAIFDKYKIDVVMSGHDHFYTRSYQMLGGLPVSTDTTVHTVNNPTGTLYLTLNSGSGSKFYPLNAAYGTQSASYAASNWQMNQPTFSYVTVNANQFSIVTYATNDTTTWAIDNYTITKVPGTAIPTIAINGSSSNVTIPFGSMLNLTVSVTANSWSNVNCDYFVYADAPTGSRYYYLNGNWQTGSIVPAVQENASNVSNYPLLSTSALPTGVYTFYFTMDNNADGIIDGNFVTASIRATIQ